MRLLFRALFATAWIAIAGLTAIKLGFWTPVRPAPPFARGSEARRVYGVDFAASAKTILLYVRSDCRFCAESMPFYKQLATSDAVASQRVQFVIISSEQETTIADYLRRHQLDGYHTVSDMHADFSRVRGTPTLVVVGRTGIVEHVAVGKQDPSGERTILDSLGT